jgi:hypothetical protein
VHMLKRTKQYSTTNDLQDGLWLLDALALSAPIRRIKSITLFRLRVRGIGDTLFNAHTYDPTIITARCTRSTGTTN